MKRRAMHRRTSGPSLDEYLAHPERYPTVGTLPGAESPSRARVAGPNSTPYGRPTMDSLFSQAAPVEPVTSDPMPAPNSEITAPGMALRSLAVRQPMATPDAPPATTPMHGLEPPDAASVSPQYLPAPNQRENPNAAWGGALQRARAGIQQENLQAYDYDRMQHMSQDQAFARQYGPFAAAMKNRMPKQLMTSQQVAGQQHAQQEQERQQQPHIDPETGWPIDPVTGQPIAPLAFEQQQAQEERRRIEQQQEDERRTRYEATGRGLRVRRRF